MFGNLGATEIIFILVIVLLVFGAKRLPEIGQSLGKGIREFRKSMTEISGEIHQASQQPQYPPPPQYGAPQQPYAAPQQPYAAPPPAQLPQAAAVPTPQQPVAEPAPLTPPTPPAGGSPA